MITVSDLTLQYSGQPLFSHVDLQFTKGNCYGIIGANGAGKSTFLKILSGELEPTKGEVSILPKTRMSVLKQNQNAYDAYNVMDTVIMGNQRLYDIGKEKEALYAKEEMTEEDGIRACELEEEYAELGGWEAESDASRILQGLGIGTELHYNDMATLDARLKVKVLLAQALFGNPDILLLDEPTNNLDINAVNWLEDFLLDFEGTVIVVSHDRHFLNTICTHIVDIDYNKIKLYVGNYDFWYESSQLVQALIKNQNKRNEEKIKELQDFIARFSANKSKSKQATARRKLLDKLTVEEMPASSRRYPWVAFSPEREVGKDILFVTDVSKTIDGVKVLDKVSFIVGHDDKIAFVGDNENAHTALFKILTGEMEPDEGTVKWGQTATFSYFPKDNTAFFEGHDENLVEWLREFSPDPHESYLRGFLGRMLFSGDDVYKSVKVLSGGEKVRCMLSKMMLSGANVLLLDQPTNHLDLESITAVNNGLEAVKCNVLFSSHDHQLVQTVANRIFDFTAEGKLIDRKMTYDEYLESVSSNG
ncbi:ATP-binding cassette domain-containing protein [Pseudoflavonifractor sp. DSM 107456]|uniref:ATP-binding cassette domain-containing protein n=2 Tax=Pseudoflavonifractor TaxID=1017280 RepID=A0ABR9R7N3_9FIRM|nr:MULTISPECIES: ATP-binding cassette domain-containing protein [Pseudoflavonifractor]MBC5729934.1 ATP-binding cassette domain-containing protein [Pseudoflavonifractor hominis]MBE5054699.1 ATP-binding cassette domain-containing protein [Pseudoflavonifractor gallinarum]MBT9683600.1 ATP-binding cassette domain-containing protein [Pseudoflavonifractor sp. MCC625]